jgi:hypothetical protein
MSGFQKMRISDSATNLFVSIIPYQGKIWSAGLTYYDDVISLWALEPSGDFYVIMNSRDNVCMTARHPSPGQQITVELFETTPQIDAQLWKVTNVIGKLYTFAPKLAPELILQTQNGGLSIRTPLTVGTPIPGPGGVGVTPSQLFVYPD